LLEGFTELFSKKCKSLLPENSRPQKRPPEGGLFFVTPLAQALPDQQL
jgi:hypothetical protein